MNDLIFKKATKQIQDLSKQLETLRKKEQKVTRLKKGEIKLFVDVLRNPEPIINPITNRVNRPVVALVQGSEYEPYQIKIHEAHRLSCNCPSWIYNQRGNRTCKHTDQVEQKIKQVVIEI